MISALLKPSIVINGKKYKIMKQIGEGGFAFVYDVLGTGKESGEHFALKKMICQTDEQLEEAKKEIETMVKLKNPHVLELLDFAYSLNKKNQKEALLLLPLYQGSVQTIIDRGHGYPHCAFPDGLDVLKILRHVVEGLKAIHAVGLRHADLKPANILLTDAYHAVITDFGSVSPSPVTIRSRAEALSAQDKAASCTTASYRAPELFNTPSECVLGGESDVWSLGCLIYCMLYSRTPFETAAEGLSTLSVISAHYQVPESNLWPEEYLEVIARCLQADPTQRETLDGVQARLQSIPCPPLDTQLSLPTRATTPPNPNATNATINAKVSVEHPAVSAASAASTASTAARLNCSTSTTSSAVSTSHLEFSEKGSLPTTPVTPGMAAVNFADFPDPGSISVTGGVGDSANISGEELYVLSRLSEAGGSGVEFASTSALSEIGFEEPTGSSVYNGSSVHGGSAHGGSAYANSIAGSVYGSAYASSIADSYVHAEGDGEGDGETLSNCSSGQHSPFDSNSHHPHGDYQADSSASHSSSSHVMIDNLPVVPVRKGLSTPNTHYSHDSFDFVEHSVGGSVGESLGGSGAGTPRAALRTTSDDAAHDAAHFASFPPFPTVASAHTAHPTAAANNTNTLLPVGVQRSASSSIGIAEENENDAEWSAGGDEAFESDEEEFGEFTTSTTLPNAANTSSSETHGAGEGPRGGDRDSNSRLQEVDLWRLITAQALPSNNGSPGTVSSGATRRHVIKEGPVWMMRQGGFPKRWAKKQVWLVLTPLGLILRKDSAPESRIHEVLSLHRPLHCTPSDTLSVGLGGVRVEGSAPVLLGGPAAGAGSGKRESRDEGDWVKVSVGGADLNGDLGSSVSGTTDTNNTTDSGFGDTAAAAAASHHQNNSSVGKCLFVRAAFEISFADKDALNDWLDALEEQRDMLLA